MKTEIILITYEKWTWVKREKMPPTWTTSVMLPKIIEDLHEEYKGFKVIQENGNGPVFLSIQFVKFHPAGNMIASFNFEVIQKQKVERVKTYNKRFSKI